MPKFTHERLSKLFKEKLQIVYGEMLEHVGTEYGDIHPGQLMRMEDAEDLLTDATVDWILSGIEENKSALDMDRQEFMGVLGSATTPTDLLNNAPRIYEYLSELFDEELMDSVLREWSFQWWTNKTNGDYSTIYEKWLGKSV